MLTARGTTRLFLCRGQAPSLPTTRYAVKHMNKGDLGDIESVLFSKAVSLRVLLGVFTVLYNMQFSPHNSN